MVVSLSDVVSGVFVTRPRYAGSACPCWDWVAALSVVTAVARISPGDGWGMCITCPKSVLSVSLYRLLLILLLGDHWAMVGKVLLIM